MDSNGSPGPGSGAARTRNDKGYPIQRRAQRKPGPPVSAADGSGELQTATPDPTRAKGRQPQPKDRAAGRRLKRENERGLVNGKVVSDQLRALLTMTIGQSYSRMSPLGFEFPPMGPAQAAFRQALCDPTKTHVFGIGELGTGKTFEAVQEYGFVPDPSKRFAGQSNGS